MSFNTYEHWTNAIDKDGTLCISYGKDSLACLRAIELLGWNLKRIVHAEVWATDTIPGTIPILTVDFTTLSGTRLGALA